jgi:transposase-like protein
MEKSKMRCPECKSSRIRKNGINKQGKQNHIRVFCGRQFIDNYETHRDYDKRTKKECLTMYVNGMGFRGIERSKGVHHTTIINWVKSVGKLLLETYEPETIPEVGKLDELETFVGSKKQNLALDSR